MTEKKIDNYELIEGDIKETIPKFIEANPAIKIALIHIDVDVYEPTKVILDNLWEKIVIGGILMLDDYGTVDGETQAVDDFFKGKNPTINKMPYYHIPSYIVK